jgi:hypothetical protein
MDDRHDEVRPGPHLGCEEPGSVRAVEQRPIGNVDPLWENAILVWRSSPIPSDSRDYYRNSDEMAVNIIFIAVIVISAPPVLRIC